MIQFDLPIYQLFVSLRAQQPIYWPAFAGSKVEGAFGRALYDISCTRRDLKTCHPCPLRSLCPYGLLYAPSLPKHLAVSSLEHPPRPLVFITELTKEQQLNPPSTFGFGLTIMGSAAHHLPYIVAAIRQMGQNGIGINRGRFELLEVHSLHPYTQQRTLIAQGDSPVVAHQALAIQPTHFPPIPPQHITLHLQTFLHLKNTGGVVETLQFPILVRALQRRISNLEQIYGGNQSQGGDYNTLPLLAREVAILEQKTQHVQQVRSGKGKQPVVMNG